MVLQVQQTGIRSETGLHYRVVSFVKKYYPDVLMSAAVGENQDTSQKRIDAWRKGFVAGAPDLVIHSHHVQYSGLAIEFKTVLGNGKVSEKQELVLAKYKRNNFATLVSCDYDEVIMAVVHYMEKVRICCPQRARKFKSSKSLEQHAKFIHKNGI